MATPPGLPRPAFTYNFAAIQCIVGGVALSNFGTDGGISFEYPSQLMESELSADGYVTYSGNNDERVRVTITLLETSGAIPLVEALIKTQVNAVFAGSPLTPVPFYMSDPATGDHVVSEYVVFLQEPAPSKTKGIGTREYILELPYARFTGAKGALNIATV